MDLEWAQESFVEDRKKARTYKVEDNTFSVYIFCSHLRLSHSRIKTCSTNTSSMLKFTAPIPTLSTSKWRYMASESRVSNEYGK